MWSGAPGLRDQGLHPLCKCSDEIWNRAAHGEGPPKPAMGVCGGGEFTGNNYIWTGDSGRFPRRGEVGNESRKMKDIDLAV